MTITKPGSYFKPGRIFRTSTTLSESEDVQTFVVLQEGQGAAVCAPLQSYDADSSGYISEGENRPLVFATGITPRPVPGKDSPRMGQFPVFVEGPSDRIDPKSRLDFSTALKIEHKAKVQNVGRIDRNYLKELKSTFLKTTGAKLPDADTRLAGVGNIDGDESGAETPAGYNYDTLAAGNPTRFSNINAPRLDNVGSDYSKDKPMTGSGSGGIVYNVPSFDYRMMPTRGPSWTPRQNEPAEDSPYRYPTMETTESPVPRPSSANSDHHVRSSGIEPLHRGMT
jgi:hypothetical protein